MRMVFSGTRTNAAAARYTRDVNVDARIAGSFESRACSSDLGTLIKFRTKLQSSTRDWLPSGAHRRLMKSTDTAQRAPLWQPHEKRVHLIITDTHTRTLPRTSSDSRLHHMKKEPHSSTRCSREAWARGGASATLRKPPDGPTLRSSPQSRNKEKALIDWKPQKLSPASPVFLPSASSSTSSGKHKPGIGSAAKSMADSESGDIGSPHASSGSKNSSAGTLSSAGKKSQRRPPCQLLKLIKKLTGKPWKMCLSRASKVTG